MIVAETSSSPFAFFDAGFVLRWANASFEALMGVPCERLCGMGIADLFTQGAGGDPLELVLNQTLDSQTVYRGGSDVDLETLGGRRCRVAVSAIPVSREQGIGGPGVLLSLIEATCLSYFDVDDRVVALELRVGQQNEELEETRRALEHLRERLQMAFNAADIGTWEIDAETLDVHMGESSSRIFRLGTGSEAVAFERYLELVHPEDREAIRHNLEEGLRTGSEVGNTFRGILPDGDLRWFMTRGRAMLGEDGRAVRMVGAVVDVTEQKQVEEQREQLLEQLEFERRRLETVLTYMPSGGVVAEAPSGRIIMINAQMCDYSETLAQPSDGIADYSRLEGYHPDGRRYEAKEWPLARSILTGEIVRDEEIHLTRRDGTRGVLTFSSAPIRDAAGRIMAGVVIVRDVTERQEMEARLRNLNQTLEQRIAQRTSRLLRYQQQLRALAVELSASEQRERRRLAGELHDYLAQLLVAIKLKSGRVQGLVRSPEGLEGLHELNEMLDECITYTRTLISDLSPSVLYEAGFLASVDWLAQQMARHGLTVDVIVSGLISRLPEDVAIVVFQAVHELLFNVVKHARVDRASVTLIQADGILTVTVEDCGCGFAPPDFEEFRGTSTTNFGLLNVHERLEAICGHLEVHSAVGEGTRAIVYVPLAAETCDEVEAGTDTEDVAEPEVEEVHAVVRVLIADDHKIIRRGLRALLANVHDLYVVGEASDGKETVEMVRTLHPDVVIMDVNMPKLNGIEATRQIKQECEDVLVVGLSVYQDAQIAESMRDAGAEAYLVKGDPLDGLYEALERARAEAAVA